MNPDHTLSRIREILAGPTPGLHDGMELAELVAALDDQLSDGGWPPTDWIGPATNTASWHLARRDAMARALREAGAEVIAPTPPPG